MEYKLFCLCYEGGGAPGPVAGKETVFQDTQRLEPALTTCLVPWALSLKCKPFKNAGGRGSREKRNASIFTMKTSEDTEITTK